MRWFRRLIGLDRLPEDSGALERLEYAMLRLSRKDREIFFAARLDNMTYPEIADVTGLSVEQVERAVTRALVAIDHALS